MADNKVVEEEKRLNDLLKDVYVEDLGFGFAGKVLYVLVNGDWKHDHLRCQYLLEEDGYSLINECIVEEDGSDFYKAEYTFRKVA